MWKGRTIVFVALALLAGDFLGGILTFHPAVYLSASAVFAVTALYSNRCKGVLPAICLILLGAAAVQVGRMPPPQAESILSLRAAKVKAAVSNYMDSFIPQGDELAIMKALAIGDKGDISRELKSFYQASGAMHLLALSGLHVGIIYGMLTTMLSILGGARIFKFLKSAVTLTLLWSFALVSGLSSSIARAVLMISFYEIGGFAGASKDSLTALCASAIVVILINPEAPREISFQLSYSAVLSICLIFPRLRRLLATKSRLLKKIWDSICIAISCQMTCGVLGWLYFGTFPKYFLLTGVLAVPVATIALYAVIEALIVHNVPYLGTAAAIAANSVLKLLNAVIETIASLP